MGQPAGVPQNQYACWENRLDCISRTVAVAPTMEDNTERRGRRQGRADIRRTAKSILANAGWGWDVETLTGLS